MKEMVAAAHSWMEAQPCLRQPATVHAAAGSGDSAKRCKPNLHACMYAVAAETCDPSSRVARRPAKGFPQSHVLSFCGRVVLHRAGHNLIRATASAGALLAVHIVPH